MFVLVGAVSAVSWIVRYRILNMYSRLPPEPQRKEPEIDLFPDTHEEGSKGGFASYLDEFLSAIKIFGYLERPVFHELTRSMQTRKLIAGETINLEEEKGFCIVVDGLVEIFVISGRHSSFYREPPPAHDLDSSGDDDDVPADQQRYQLLTEVRNGAPMSSLFSIMSLFTEDVKLRLNDDSPILPPNSSSRHQRHGSVGEHGTQRFNSVPVSMPNTPHLDGKGGHHNIVHDTIVEDDDKRSFTNSHHGPSSSIPPISLDDPSRVKLPRPKPPGRTTSHSAHPDIIARATRDTTIAIIPASAFRRLIRIYPKATSHIVHVILSRFQRVTLAHAFDYLGLTGEILHTEKSMNKYTVCQLPNILRGDALSRLKEKFKHERARIAGDEERNGIALHNAAAIRRRRSSSTTLRKEAMLSSMVTQPRPASILGSSDSSPQQQQQQQQHPQPAQHGSDDPGDLANVHASRNAGRPPLTPGRGMRDLATPLAHRSFNPFDSQRHARIPIDGRESLDEDNLFRSSILECMFKSLGLYGSAAPSREPESVEASPRLYSADHRRRAFSPNNAFGSIGPFDSCVDGENDSVTSGGLTTHTPPSAQALSHEMKDDVEIVFFPKGSVLVEQGERNPGLYYVVDGFLDIGTYTTEQGTQSILQTSSTTSLDVDSDENGTRARPDNQKKAGRTRRSVSLVKPGGLAGYIGSVSSYRSFIDVVAKTDVYVGFLPRAALERIVDRYPIVLLTMAKRLTHVLPRLILHIDFALEWVQVNAGQVIFHGGDESEAIYIVLNGRLRLVEDRKNGGMTALAEFGQGESVGELEVLTETVRPGTLHAIRDTELVKFPRTLFNSLAQEHPNITIKISKIIASRMRAAVDDPPKNGGKDAGSGATNNPRKSTMNLRTVAILPVTAGVPVVEFGNRLMNALAQVGPPNGATSLNQAAILNHLGKHAFNKMGKLRLTQYLADLEEKYGLVVYVAGKNLPRFWFFFFFFTKSNLFHDENLSTQRQCR